MQVRLRPQEIHRLGVSIRSVTIDISNSIRGSAYQEEEMPLLLEQQVAATNVAIEQQEVWKHCQRQYDKARDLTGWGYNGPFSIWASTNQESYLSGVIGDSWGFYRLSVWGAHIEGPWWPMITWQHLQQKQQQHQRWPASIQVSSAQRTYMTAPSDSYNNLEQSMARSGKEDRTNRKGLMIAVLSMG